MGFLPNFQVSKLFHRNTSPEGPNANGQGPIALMTLLTWYPQPPQVHDPQEFNPNRSMTSVTLHCWFWGVIFARNVQHWPIRAEGEFGYFSGRKRRVAQDSRIRQGRNRRTQGQPQALFGHAKCDTLSDQAADFCKIEDGRTSY